MCVVTAAAAYIMVASLLSEELNMEDGSNTDWETGG